MRDGPGHTGCGCDSSDRRREQTIFMHAFVGENKRAVQGHSRSPKREPHNQHIAQHDVHKQQISNLSYIPIYLSTQ